MTVPTWLMYLFLAIAAVGPHVSLWPRWWIAYYGALLACWVVMSVGDMRRAAREERQTQRHLARMLQQQRAVPGPEAAEIDADTVGPELAEERLIIVARDKGDLYDRLRNDQSDGTVTVIEDRRRADRRRKLELFIPERRLGDRRQCDVSQLLVTQGWAELTAPKR